MTHGNPFAPGAETRQLPEGVSRQGGDMARTCDLCGDPAVGYAYGDNVCEQCWAAKSASSYDMLTGQEITDDQCFLFDGSSSTAGEVLGL